MKGCRSGADRKEDRERHLAEDRTLAEPGRKARGGEEKAWGKARENAWSLDGVPCDRRSQEPSGIISESPLTHSPRIPETGWKGPWQLLSPATQGETAAGRSASAEDVQEGGAHGT